MKKQGFTLIELMVVIVIMGILAAVAVPKLFGMIAKSKASEVGPAAGEYVKLQDAYVAETGIYVGNWTKIGYKMDNTTNFNYSDPELATGTDGTTAISGLSAKKGWQAEAVAALNDCAKNSTWFLELTGNSTSGGAVSYKADYSDEPNCSPLTASFKLIGK